ncbi:MAG TPA: prepilin-type N-terminal cleavage/methylation domain-containing protein, partial [Patescibacteria group bacterium]
LLRFAKHFGQAKRCRRGFSLVEVLITLTVLTLGIGGVSVLMLSSIRNTENAKNQIIASQLAQEGIELVRNFHDNKNSSTNPFSSQLQSNSNYKVGPAMDFGLFQNSYNNSKYKQLTLLEMPTNGTVEYRYGGLKPSKFFRTIDIKPNTLLKKVGVTAYVFWGGGTTPPDPCNLGNKCVSATSDMLD